jgi:hypothetical protein
MKKMRNKNAKYANDAYDRLYGRLATAMTRAVSRRHGTPDGDDGDNEPMWSLELASSWARLDVACGSHALAECEP